MSPSASTSTPRVVSTITACGDVLDRDGDVLVIRAQFPIEELEPARFRAPVLLVGCERFVIVAKDGPAETPRYTLRRKLANAYEPDGVVIAYDAARHLVRRTERQRTAVAWLLFVALIPLMPLLGFLPERCKRSFIGIGIDGTLASRLSVPLQTLAAAACVAAHFRAGAIFTLPGLALAALAFFLAADAAYRTSEHRDGRAPGAFALVLALAGMARSVVARC